MKKILLGVFLCSALSMAHAENTTTTQKTTAILAATCTMSATSVSLGALILPLSNQSSTGQMSVLCNKQTNYKIDMAYGGIYGVGSSNPNLVLKSINNGQAQYYNIETKVWGNNTFSTCGAGCIPTGYVNTKTTLPASYGGVCGTGGNGCYVYAIPGSYYDYGILNGTSKGDKIGYYIGLPNDNSKVWNTGNNSHTGVGTGQVETLPLKVNILTNKSSSLYPAPDFYIDTVTSQITF